MFIIYNYVADYFLNKKLFPVATNAQIHNCRAKNSLSVLKYIKFLKIAFT